MNDDDEDDMEDDEDDDHFFNFALICAQGFFFANLAIFDNLLIISLQICVDLCSRMDVRKGLILDAVH